MPRQIKNAPVPGWVSLANAVVEHAASDLRWSKPRLYHRDPRTRQKARRLYQDCIRFFTGPDLDRYTDLDGPSLLRRLQTE